MADDTEDTVDKPDTTVDKPNTADTNNIDNVISFAFAKELLAAPKNGDALDDDVLIQGVKEKITQWKNAGTPTFTQVQELFHDSICAGASAMARDKIIAAIITAFGTELGGKRAMVGTWVQIAKDYAADCAQDARENIAQPELTPEQKAALRESLWPNVSELAQAPDLMDRVVQQVQAMGVVNECELIILTYIAATSRVLEHPINILTKGASSGGKSFTIMSRAGIDGS